MDLHLLDFFRSQAARLIDDVLGNRELANVVQQRGGAQGFDFVFRQAQFFGDFDSEHTHTLEMFMRRMILSLDRERQALDGAQVERGHILGVLFFDLDLFLFRRQLGQIEVIGAVDPIDERQNKERRLPSHLFAEEADRENDGRAHHVEGERPEMAFGPDLMRRLVFRDRNDDGHWNRIRQEKDQRGDDQKRKRSGAEHALQRMIGEIREDDGIRHHAEYVEKNFKRNPLLPRSEEALRQSGGAAENQRLRKVQLQDAEQNEKKVDRHRAIEAGQSNLEARSQNGDKQVAGEPRQIDTLPVP